MNLEEAAKIVHEHQELNSVITEAKGRIKALNRTKNIEAACPDSFSSSRKIKNTEINVIEKSIEVWEELVESTSKEMKQIEDGFISP